MTVWIWQLDISHWYDLLIAVVLCNMILSIQRSTCNITVTTAEVTCSGIIWYLLFAKVYSTIMRPARPYVCSHALCILERHQNAQMKEFRQVSSLWFVNSKLVSLDPCTSDMSTVVWSTWGQGRAWQWRSSHPGMVFMYVRAGNVMMLMINVLWLFQCPGNDIEQAVSVTGKRARTTPWLNPEAAA